MRVVSLSILRRSTINPHTLISAMTGAQKMASSNYPHTLDSRHVPVLQKKIL